MKQIVFLIFIFSLNFTLFSQSKVNVSGIIKDETTGEVLIGVLIRDTLNNQAVFSDYNGYFSIETKPNSVLMFNALGFSNFYLERSKIIDNIITVNLKKGINLDEVSIHVNKQNAINTTSINSKDLMNIPALGGKPDLGKSLQLLPGVTAQNEGSSNLNVRGGDAGQNLYLLDNIPLIHVNHLGGFFSVFNSEIINNVDLYKGGFPAKYGGKLSSIIDITQKEGNSNQSKGSFSIGLTDLSLTLEGPTKIKNTSYIVSARKTLIDLPLMLITGIYGKDELKFSYGFHDLNSKFTWKPNQKNTFHLSTFYGEDYINAWQNYKEQQIEQKFRYSNIWGNFMVSAHWKSILSEKLYSNTSISYSRYRLKDWMNYTVIDSAKTETYYKNYSSVQDISLRNNFKWSLNKRLVFDVGLQSTLRYHLPNYSIQNNISSSKTKFQSSESALYIENKIKLFNNTLLSLGLRGVGFYNKDYHQFSLEPRLNLDFPINIKQLLNISYMKVNQFNHLVYSNGAIMSNEIWIPANNQILPPSSEQYSIGWRGNFAKNKWIAEVNLYHKNYFNLATFKEGYTNFSGDENWSNKIETNGKGLSSGVEFILKKSHGKINGFLSYTYSNSNRNYKNINGGNTFMYDFDRPHSLSLFTSIQLNKALNLNLTWIYQTGLPYTPAIGKQFSPSLQLDENGQTVFLETLIYGAKNSARMRDYHRLDLGLNYEKLNKNGRKVIWSFSLYNAYNRANAFSYYYNTTDKNFIEIPDANQNQKLKLYQVNYFPIIPSIAYKVFFDKIEFKKETLKKPLQKIKKWMYYENNEN